MWLPCQGPIWQPVHPGEKKKGEDKGKSFRESSQSPTWYFHLHLNGQNLIFTILPAREAGKYVLYSGWQCVQLKIGMLKLKEKGEVNIKVGDT